MRLAGFSFIVLTLILFSCEQDTEDKILHEAHDVHMEAFKIKQSVKPQIEQLVQRSNSIQVQGRALTEEEIKFIEAVNNLSQKFSYWEENHLEVPGFDHEGHDHSGHDHSHDHGPAFNLPASDVLLLQKEFRDSIVVVRQQVQLLLQE